MKTLQELKILVRMTTARGEVVPQEWLDEIAQHEAKIAEQQQKQQALQEERKQAFKGMFADLSTQISQLMAEEKKKTEEEQQLLDRFASVLTHVDEIKSTLEEKKQQTTEQFIEEIIEALPEEIIEETIAITPPTIVEAAAKHVSETVAPSMFVQPDPPTVGRDIQDIQRKLKLLEGWVGKISMAGPGGGEVNFRYLDDVNRNTMTTSNDNWVLEYDASTKKVQFTENVGPVRTIKINTTGRNIDPVAGMLAWNPDEDCLDIHQADGTTLQTGLENYIRVHNHTGSVIPNGTVVRFAGVEDINSIAVPVVAKYVADSSASPLFLIGVLTTDLAVNGLGRATILGYVRNIDTTGSSVGEVWSRGDLLWGHPTIPGAMTKVRPTAPNVATSIAAVARVGTTDGQLLVRPTVWPRLYYGDWYDTTNQTAAAANTAYPIRVNGTGYVSGFELNADNTAIKALNAGRYNFEFSLQVTSTNSSLARMWIWYRKNNVDVPNSATVVTVRENGGKLAPSWNFPVLMDANDTFTLMWATESTNVSLATEPATAFCPAIPSVIITVSQTNL